MCFRNYQGTIRQKFSTNISKKCLYFFTSSGLKLLESLKLVSKGSGVTLRGGGWGIKYISSKEKTDTRPYGIKMNVNTPHF